MTAIPAAKPAVAPSAPQRGARTSSAANPTAMPASAALACCRSRPGHDHQQCAQGVRGLGELAGVDEVQQLGGDQDHRPEEQHPEQGAHAEQGEHVATGHPTCRGPRGRGEVRHEHEQQCLGDHVGRCGQRQCRGESAAPRPVEPLDTQHGGRHEGTGGHLRHRVRDEERPQGPTLLLSRSGPHGTRSREQGKGQVTDGGRQQQGVPPLVADDEPHGEHGQDGRRDVENCGTHHAPGADQRSATVEVGAIAEHEGTAGDDPDRPGHRRRHDGRHQRETTSGPQHRGAECLEQLWSSRRSRRREPARGDACGRRPEQGEEDRDRQQGTQGAETVGSRVAHPGRVQESRAALGGQANHSQQGGPGQVARGHVALLPQARPEACRTLRTARSRHIVGSASARG